MNKIRAVDFYVGNSDIDGPSLECPSCWWYVYLDDPKERTLKHLFKEAEEHIKEKHSHE